MAFIFLFNCQRPNADDRAILNEKLTGTHIGNFQVIAQEGTAHFLRTQINDTRIHASAPELQLDWVRSKDGQQYQSIRLKNLVPFTEIKISGLDQDVSTMSDKSGFLHLDFTISEGIDKFTISTLKKPSEPFYFAAMGDIQDGIENFTDVIAKLNQDQDIDFILFLGDLTMNSTQDEFKAIKSAFKLISTPIYSTPGNHDVSHPERYQSIFGATSYSFIYKSTRFTSIDSASWTLSSTLWKRILNWLTLGQNQTHIIYSHIAPTEPYGMRGGHWKSRREANMFLSKASSHFVDAMFFGHLHTYDYQTIAGVPLYISGGAGAFEEKFDGIKRHYLKVFVRPDNQEIFVEKVLID